MVSYRPLILIFLACFSLAALPADAKGKKVRKQKTNSTTAQKAIQVRYMEQYGSVCCPKDPHWTTLFLVDYVKQFNAENNVAIKEVYNRIMGKEGEQLIVLSLNELKPALQEKFIRQRTMNESSERQQEALKLWKAPKPISTYIPAAADIRKIPME